MPTEKKNLKPISTSLTQEVYDMLSDVAKKTKLTKGAIIEEYVARGLCAYYEEHNPKSKVYAKYLKLQNDRKL